MNRNRLIQGGENFETLKKGVKDTRKQSDLCSWMGRICIMKMSMSLKTLYKCSLYNEISIKLPMAFFTSKKIQI